MGNVGIFHLQFVMPLIPISQGAKAAQKRERNADKNAAKGSKSQAKVNEAAKNIVCQTCKQPFVSPVSQKHLDMRR